MILLPYNPALQQRAETLRHSRSVRKYSVDFKRLFHTYVRPHLLDSLRILNICGAAKSDTAGDAVIPE